jgi:hypothetical protein
MRTTWLIVSSLLVGISPLYASVSLEVGTGVFVETTSGASVEIDGSLTETGTGYFKGTISSGSRTGMTTFAGLTLSSGMNGTITRVSGSAYAQGNGEGTNFKRYYELNNSGGSAVTADMAIVFVSSGDNDERNGLSSPYYIYRYASDWTGHGDGSSSSPVSTSSMQIPTGSSDWILSDGSFVTFSDTETASVEYPIYFNESGDGRQLDMMFSSFDESGSVTVDQNNHCPTNAPCCNGCGYQFDITKGSGITSFSVDITFHYTDTDASGFTESGAYFGIAKFNSSTNTWQWLGGTVDADNNTVTLTGVTSFSTFALFRRIFGDCTDDGYVDAADLQHLGDCWHQTNSGEFDAGCDTRFFNYNKNTDDGKQIIDAADLQVFGDCWHNGEEPSMMLKEQTPTQLKPR